MLQLTFKKSILDSELLIFRKYNYSSYLPVTFRGFFINLGKIRRKIMDFQVKNKLYKRIYLKPGF